MTNYAILYRFAFWHWQQQHKQSWRGLLGGNNDFDDPDINCDPLGTCYDGKKLFKQQQMCCAIMNFS